MNASFFHDAALRVLRVRLGVAGNDVDAFHHGFSGFGIHFDHAAFFAFVFAGAHKHHVTLADVHLGGVAVLVDGLGCHWNDLSN
jgi:hypothetical protein